MAGLTFSLTQTFSYTTGIEKARSLIESVENGDIRGFINPIVAPGGHVLLHKGQNGNEILRNQENP
ncbi:hypothetical protein JCM16138_00070 [Thermococcus atlanticus]